MEVNDKENKDAIDANDVIDYLTNDIAALHKQNAILHAKNNKLQRVVDEQENLLDAYENKGKLENAK